MKQLLFEKEFKNGDGKEELLQLHKSIKKNLEVLNKQFKDSPDIMRTTLSLNNGREMCVIFINGLVDRDLLQRDVLDNIQKMGDRDLFELRQKNKLPIANIVFVDKLELVIDEVLNGNTLILVDGMDYAISCSIKQFEKRAIREPEIEKVIKGSHEGFVENLDTNISILRRKVKSSSLKIRMYTVGNRSKQKVAILYLEGIADMDLVEKMGKRIKNIEFDYLVGAGYIEQLTSDSPLSPFPQYQTTERPDRAIGNMMEGRVLILLDGTPVALAVPVNFFQLFQAVDDYTVHWLFGSFLRLLRIIAIFIAVFFPALYIAVLTFHYQAVPLNLLIPLAESRSRVPFPPILEALLMEVTFELIRESSIRLPQSLGPTIGIVGGLVIGQTAIQAGIVSNIMVIVVAVTAIATFVVPTYDMGLLLRLSRFGAMILASFFGIVGVTVYGMFILAHMLTLESLGQPYFQPIIPWKFSDIKDTIIRAPLNLLRKRPDIAHPVDKSRTRKNNGK